ncbi:MAG: RDD family protein [Phycisphaerales bacterium]|nr:MAG: RDD family protein [Phycisphaerales bacterium]
MLGSGGASSAAAVGETERRPQPGDFGLASGEQIVWAYQRRLDDDQVKLVRFAYRTATEEGGSDTERFHLLWQPAVQGRIALTAVRGENLHVLYREGTHMRYVAPALPPRMAGLAKTQFVELNLPDAVLPRALAADEQTDTILALVTERQAARVDEIQERAEARRKNKRSSLRSPAGLFPEDVEDESIDEAPTQSEESGPEESTETPHARPPLAIVCYKEGAWLRDRSAPPHLELDSTVLAMLAASETVHLIHVASDGSGRLAHTMSLGPEEEWTEPEIIPLTEDAMVWAEGWREETPDLLIGRPGTGGHNARILEWVDGTWMTGPSLMSASGSETVFDQKTAFAISRRAVIGLRRPENANLEAARWSLMDGSLTEPFAEIEALLPPPMLSVPPWLVYAVEFILFGFFFATVFFWRRGIVVQPAPLLDVQMIATPSKRLWAFIIDTIIMAPLWGPVLYSLGGLDRTGMSLWDQLMAGHKAPVPVLMWFWPTFGAIYAIYGVVFEASIQATPGKRIARCYVVRHGGTRASLGAILVRNLLRVPEFYFLPTLLLVFLTINRQRFGDVLARTVVVEHRRPPAPADKDSDRDTYEDEGSDR